MYDCDFYFILNNMRCRSVCNKCNSESGPGFLNSDQMRTQVFSLCVLVPRLTANLHVVACMWWLACGGLHVVACMWWLACGGLHVVACMWWLACGGLRHSVRHAL